MWIKAEGGSYFRAEKVNHVTVCDGRENAFLSTNLGLISDWHKCEIMEAVKESLMIFLQGGEGTPRVFCIERAVAEAIDHV